MRLRRLFLWAFLCAVAVLALLSIVGACLGADRAGELFRSPPLAVFWVFFTALFVAGLFSFKSLVRSPALLAMHVGSLAILLGAVYGSDAGHKLVAGLGGPKKVPSGYMAIFEGETTNVIRHRELSREIGRLPFSLRLNDFRIEYYDLEDRPWELFVDAPASREKGHETHRRQARIEWAEGKDVAIPFTHARLRVLKYLRSARPTYDPEARPVLEITGPDGTKTTTPAAVGREVSLENPKVTVRIVRVFTNPKVVGSGESRRVIDEPGPTANPALRLEVEHADGTKETRFVMSLLPMHGQTSDGLILRYAFPEPTGAEADPDTGLPAMELAVDYQGQEVQHWLIAREDQPFVQLPLGPFIEACEDMSREECDGTGDCDQDMSPGGGAGPSLYLVKPVGQIEDFKSDVLIIDEGEQVGGKVIEVNHPLYYGGYHFYQHAYDTENESYTILSVRSDSGLKAVYAGFVLLCVGVFWGFWVQPAWSYLSGRRDAGV